MVTNYSCSEAGISGAIVGMLGTFQAAECLKYITPVGALLSDALLVFHAKTMDFRKIKIRPNLDCSICGDNPSIAQIKNEEQSVCDFNQPG